MALTNKRVGARVITSIGRPGEPLDYLDARIVGTPQMTQLANGRIAEVATVIEEKVSLQTGEKYLHERVANLRFAFDRTERNEALDGTEQEPLSVTDLLRNVQAQVMAFTKSRSAGQSVDVSELA